MSGCCAIDFDGGDIAVRYQVAMRRARKEYSCAECKGTINPGEKYEYVRGLWSGKYDTYRTCTGCLEIRDHFCDGGFNHSYLYEQIGDCIGSDIGIGDLDGMGPKAIDRIEKYLDKFLD